MLHLEGRIYFMTEIENTQYRGKYGGIHRQAMEGRGGRRFGYCHLKLIRDGVLATCRLGIERVRRIRSMFNRWPVFFLALAAGWISLMPAAGAVPATPDDTLLQTLRHLSADGDRSTGTPGCARAGGFIREQLVRMGYVVDHQQFQVPVRRHGGSRLVIPDQGLSVPIHPMPANAVSPETIPSDGIEGPLVYVGSGEMARFNGKAIAGAVVLMDLASAKNWLNAASCGAAALVYIDGGEGIRPFLEDKLELSPIAFPRFWITRQRARELFGNFDDPEQRLPGRVRLTSDLVWQPAAAENLYCLIPGVDSALSGELVLVEAFYDSTPMVYGLSPGADEASGIAALLDLAARLKREPPARSVLLAATAGHAQGLAGMRELVWALQARGKDLKQMTGQLKTVADHAEKMLAVLDGLADGQIPLSDPQVKAALAERIKTRTDTYSRQLMQLRLQASGTADPERIRQIAASRLVLRQLGWRTAFGELPEKARLAVSALVPEAAADFQTAYQDAAVQLACLQSTGRLRDRLDGLKPVAAISLHLSSHGDGVGAFTEGWLYSLKPGIRRFAPYRSLERALRQAARHLAADRNLPDLYRDTLRPGGLNAWQSYLPDQPALGGEVSALGGMLGLSLVTTGDRRPYWGTPYDRVDRMDLNYVRRQSEWVCELLATLVRAPRIHNGKFPKNGFATVTGRARFVRQGELFPDQPAPETLILAYHGPSRFHCMVDTRGIFTLRGMADKKHVLDKVILEGYRFDPASGVVQWAIDKKQTGKEAYRIKMRRRRMETDLVMFSCVQTTLFDLLEPRKFTYLTKIQLIDGRREAVPLRYWYSRIDTRASTLSSVYLPPGTHLKMTLSDTVLRKKLILTRAAADRPEGKGYRVDLWPTIPHTRLHVAEDMWALLAPRIANLETHGIYDQRIRSLAREGSDALEQARRALAQRQYDRLADASMQSWALASRVYNQVEQVQKDVLFGVLFYVALFVPFAFCLERMIFSFRNIHKRILAFLGILLGLILVIYRVHPAFSLTYSPAVVILAFFIMGLSLMVTLIVFFRFEEEMVLLQRRARSIRVAEIGRWKALTAAFFLGVSNLRRRRLRTILTCVTLIILTFTIMSFTSVKTQRRHTRLPLQTEAAYTGFLLKRADWRDLPAETLETLNTSFRSIGVVAPRVWLETAERTRSVRLPVKFGTRTFDGRGAIGLPPSEPRVSGLDQILVAGRWFTATDRFALLLPQRMAAELGIRQDQVPGARVQIWGLPFSVVGLFADNALQDAPDLDGEPLTPVTFPSEQAMAVTEAEMDAIEAGEEIQTFQSRYQHTDGGLTIIMPAKTLMTLGGRLKAVAVGDLAAGTPPNLADQLADRFGLSLFSGQAQGTFLYHAGDTLAYSGVPNILIPMLISVLIVLNTMIGSVYERKREIGIYTSVGLAPSHVAFLFVAEALAFGVLSVVLGYLTAQTAATLFSRTPLWAGITVNYSSLAGVAAMLLVIGVVLISVVYPARVAARIAIPDVKKSWTLPEPAGNRLELSLPFLMNYREHASVGGFLFAYFKAHEDISHGIFATGQITRAMTCPAGPPGLPGACTDPCIVLRLRVWLAPFDFGIMQAAELQFCPAPEDPGFLEIKVRLERLAGEANMWKRVNKAFFHDLRKQLLVWRSLDPAVQQEYDLGLADV